MDLFGFFGWGRGALVTRGTRVQGVVTDVKPCRWFKVNTKPVRSCSADGAVYPHAVTFAYTASGKTYHGTRYLQWTQAPPARGAAVTVYYDPDKPARYTVTL